MTGSFAADGFIKATPATDGAALYFGTTGGSFYALAVGTLTPLWVNNLATGSILNSAALSADGVLYFATEACSYTTGQVVLIDGGCSAH